MGHWRLLTVAAAIGLAGCGGGLIGPDLDASLVPVQDTAGLPRVLLVGDSISMGYTIPTRERLAGRVNVHRIPSNGQSTSAGITYLDDWLGDSIWDVIVFNFGLHDVLNHGAGPQVTPEQYEANLHALIPRLRARSTSLVWASTTPSQAESLAAKWSNQRIVAYNAIAAAVMDEAGIPVVDLYSAVWPRLRELQLGGDVHFRQVGYEVLADHVAAGLLESLGPLDTARGVVSGLGLAALTAR